MEGKTDRRDGRNKTVVFLDQSERDSSHVHLQELMLSFRFTHFQKAVWILQGQIHSKRPHESKPNMNNNTIYFNVTANSIKPKL